MAMKFAAQHPALIRGEQVPITDEPLPAIQRGLVPVLGEKLAPHLAALANLSISLAFPDPEDPRRRQVTRTLGGAPSIAKALVGGVRIGTIGEPRLELISPDERNEREANLRRWVSISEGTVWKEESIVLARASAEILSGRGRLQHRHNCLIGIGITDLSDEKFSVRRWNGITIRS